jgi:hypothetical protein
MVNQRTRIIYCVDTSSLVTIQRIYRLSKLEGVWEFLDGLANEGRLAAPREVLKELEAGQDDEIYQWAKKHIGIFRQLTQEQWQVAQDIVNDPKYKGFIDPDKEIPEADPFVIALAVEEQKQTRLIPEQWIIVADEIPAKQGKKPRIPDVRRDPRYNNIECISTKEWFEREGLRLVRQQFSL